MIQIYVDFNLAEIEESKAVEAKYQKLMEECEAEIERLRPDPAPNTNSFFKGISWDENPEEWEAATKRENEAISAWEKAGSPEWRNERERWDELYQELNNERSNLYNRAEKRCFEALGSDPLSILADAKWQINKNIELRYTHYKNNLSAIDAFSAFDVVALGGNRWKLDAGETRNILKRCLYRHINALQNESEMLKQLYDYIETALKTNPYIAPEGTPGRGETVTIRQRAKSGELIPRVSEAPACIESVVMLSEQNGFIRMLQGTGTNQLALMSSHRVVPQIDAITGMATLSYNNFSAYINDYNNLPGLLKLNALIFLDFCTLYLSQLNNYGDSTNLKTTVSIPLKEYMRRCDIPITKASTDKTRREIKEALITLYNISIEFDEIKTIKNKKTPEHYSMRILEVKSDVKNGIVYAVFGQTFVNYLNACGLMEYPTALLKIDRRNPTVYHIGRKLCYHNSIDNNRKRGTSNNISVKALLECCPDIPSYEEVSETDRHYERRIIKPFEEALNALRDNDNVLSSWEYCNSKKAPLSDEQLNNLCYETFVKLQIKFDITNAPDPKDRLADKEKEAKKRNSRKQVAINKACKKKAETAETQSES